MLFFCWVAGIGVVRGYGVACENAWGDGYCFFVVWGNMGRWWVWDGLVSGVSRKGEGVLVGHQHEGMESLSERSARDRNGKPEVRGRGAWADLEWIARPEVSEGAASRMRQEAELLVKNTNNGVVE